MELRALRDASTGPLVRHEGAAHDAWKAKTVAVMRQALGVNSSTLNRFADLSYHIGVYSGAPGEAEQDRQYFAQQVLRAGALIEAAIYEVELMMDSDQAQPARDAAAGPRTVFLVHGHDGSAKYAVARFVERVTEVPLVILDEQVNRGRTLVEKFEAHAASAAFAIVLLTPDDVGRVKSAPQSGDQPRARQNVVFELGFFFGKLGRDRVAVINAGVEEPSDVEGLSYINYPTGNWQVELAKELQAAGIPVDSNRLL